MGAFAVVIFKSPLAHGGVGKSPAFQVLYGVTVFSLLVGGFLRFPAFVLAVTFFGVAVTSEKVSPLGEVGFFGLAAAPAVQKPGHARVALRLWLCFCGKPANMCQALNHKNWEEICKGAKRA